MEAVLTITMGFALFLTVLLIAITIDEARKEKKERTDTLNATKKVA
ncbi:MAG: hypothetical protein V2A69_13225 [Pseudomonadota bacterium]